ncbi:MAG: SRPBCC family protein, partial [Actinomycetota bacterium]|nr:SRPBCC family protein [Actinomycetota bacterium]
MTRWHLLEPTDASIFRTAPVLYRFPIKLAVPPARVWDSLASERSVADWGLGVQSLTWTSSRPFGIGTTREVVLP